VIVYEIAAKLPPIDVLRDRCTALAMVERKIDGGGPYYTYTSRWGDDEAALMSTVEATNGLWCSSGRVPSSACSTTSHR
jgi:hypothetical protein